MEVPAAVVARLRTTCAALPESYEEPAWVGTRWRIRKKTFAHVLIVGGGWPPAYVRATGTGDEGDEPACVLTFRSTGEELEALTGTGYPFFRPLWGTNWGIEVAGLVLDDSTDWPEVAELLTESYCLLAPKKLAAQVRSSHTA